MKPSVFNQPSQKQDTGPNLVFLNIFYPKATTSPSQSAGSSDDNSVFQKNLRDLFDAITQVTCFDLVQLVSSWVEIA